MVRDIKFWQVGLILFLSLVLLYIIIESKSQRKKALENKPTTVFLYPGYITKNNGKILWHSQKPVFDNESEQWINLKAVDVTNCIHDPWPAETGGEKLILEVKDYDSQK